MERGGGNANRDQMETIKHMSSVHYHQHTHIHTVSIRVCASLSLDVL
jgi:hypothetical protein